MNKNLIGIMAAIAMAAVLLTCKAANQRPKPNKFETDPHQIQNPTPTANPNQTLPIHLSIGSFDPLSDRSPIIISDELIIPKYEENEIGYYILQFKGPVLQQWKDEVISAGATLFDYIPKFAFLTRMNSQTCKTVLDMGSVRWVGIYQPAYRIAPDLITKIPDEDNRSVDVIVSVFRGEDISTISAKIKHLGGEIIQISDLNEKLKLKIPIKRIPSLSRLTGIKYIEKAPEFKISPGTEKKGGE